MLLASSNWQLNLLALWRKLSAIAGKTGNYYLFKCVLTCPSVLTGANKAAASSVLYLRIRVARLLLSSH